MRILSNGLTSPALFTVPGPVVALVPGLPAIEAFAAFPFVHANKTPDLHLLSPRIWRVAIQDSISFTAAHDGESTLDRVIHISPEHRRREVGTRIPWSLFQQLRRHDRLVAMACDDDNASGRVWRGIGIVAITAPAFEERFEESRVSSRKQPRTWP